MVTENAGHKGLRRRTSTALPSTLPTTGTPTLPATPDGHPVGPQVQGSDLGSSKRLARPGRPGRAGQYSERTTPFERFGPDEQGAVWSLTDLSSACPDAHLAAPERIDPYWGGLWLGGGSALWSSYALLRRQAAAGMVRLPAVLAGDSAAALATFGGISACNGVKRRDRIALLGALHGWRTMSAQQASAFVGTDLSSRRHPRRVVTDSVLAGLIDVGTSIADRSAGLFGPHTLLRPSKGDTFDRRVTPHLTWAEWLSVTAGQQWTAAGQFDRHNVLAAELGLRAGEYLDVATVLGERFSTTDLLTGTGVDQPEVTVDQRTADLTIVRHDGARVAIELTATVSKYFGLKVAKWARVLAERGTEDNGLSVIFLVAPPPDGSSVDISTVRSQVYQAVSAACRNHPGPLHDRVAARIGVATWREWFPRSHALSEHFLAMRADVALGQPGPGLWESMAFADPAERPLHAKNPGVLRAVSDNASMLGQTPYWMRTGVPPNFKDDLLAAAGWDQVPMPSPHRPGVVPRDPARDYGIAGVVKGSHRLQGLAADPLRSQAVKH